MLEGPGFKNTIKNSFKGSQTAWKKFLEPTVKVAAPCIGMAVRAKSKKPTVGQATINILKSLSGGKSLSLTDLLGKRTSLKSLWNHFK